MISLKLLPGPVLRYLAYPMPEAKNVAEVAHRFLFDVVEVAEGVRLQDVLGLFEACPALVDIFARSFAEDVINEVRLGPLPDEDTQHERIEYLSVQQTWMVNTLTQEHDHHHIELVGLGPVLTEDSPHDYAKAGERITWGLSASNIRKLLPLPLRIEPSVSIQEGDIDAKRWHEVVSKAIVPDLKLGELINAIFDTLTFHGGPAESREFVEEMREMVADLKEHPEKAIPMDEDDFFFSDDRPTVSEMFSEVAGYKVRDISQAVRHVDDSANAAEVLEAELPGVLVVEQYRAHTGREFRKAFREVRSEERLAKMKERLDARRSKPDEA
jgi:hypothetical protein